MKKARIFLVLTVILALFLTGCEASPFEKARSRVVEIGEQYLNYEITASEARELLDDILVPETEGNGQTYLKGDINSLSFAILQGESYEDVQEKVERIKETNYTN